VLVRHKPGVIRPRIRVTKAGAYLGQGVAKAFWR
jgi:hypothetical protein